MGAEPDSYSVLERVFRAEAGRLTASLVRLLGDFDLAEEMVSEAVVEALKHWPKDGVPERASSWLLTTAKRKGLDRLRRDAKYKEKLALVAALPTEPPRDADDRLRLIFTCCHPVLAREAQIALTLRAIVGLTTAEIARAFMIPEETLAKRLVRAKRKIVDSGVPYRIPGPDELGGRLDEVLAVIYLVFNEGYVATAGPQPIRRDLAADAEWLATLLARLMPEEPEALGLLALIRLHLARWRARLDEGSRLVLLEAQDRTLWDQRAIGEAVQLVEHATAMKRPGRYQVEAAIAALHCEAATWAATDWPQILALYTLLAQIDRSATVRLNRAIALSYVSGPEDALAEVESLRPELDRYHLFHATRAQLLRELGRLEEADRAAIEGIELTQNDAERNLMAAQLTNSPRTSLGSVRGSKSQR